MHSDRMTLTLSNREARWLWLDAQGLAATPTGPLDVPAIIDRLGFVQLDTIRVIARAHHHILWSRNQNYREPMLNRLMARDRAVFEHFTHDASILPIAAYPYWQRQFERLGQKVKSWESTRSTLNEIDRAALIERIRQEGPLSTHAFDTKAPEKAMWVRPPHKIALDYLWYLGELATSHRENFTKFYDLPERVIPAPVRAIEKSHDEQIDWLNRSALERLGFGSDGDIMRFWAATTIAEVKTWRQANPADWIDLAVRNKDGSTSKHFAPANIEERLATLAPPTSRLRILNPFDPVIRDRTRLKRLFGFDYRIEIFVPAAERRWGYYIYPLLERDRLVGRLEAKADRQKGEFLVSRFWPEQGVRWEASRWRKLEAEVERMARFVGTPEIIWAKDLRA